MELPLVINLHNILAFLEYLHQNSLYVKVIKNYLSLISTMASLYLLDCTAISHPFVLRYLRGLYLSSPFKPTPGAFLMFLLYISFQSNVTSYPIHFFSELFFSHLFMLLQGCQISLPIAQNNLTLKHIF